MFIKYNKFIKYNIKCIKNIQRYCFIKQTFTNKNHSYLLKKIFIRYQKLLSKTLFQLKEKSLLFITFLFYFLYTPIDYVIYYVSANNVGTY